MGSIPGWGRSPGGGHGSPFQYSFLENPLYRGAWWATVHRVTKSRTWLKWLGTYIIKHTILLAICDKELWLLLLTVTENIIWNPWNVRSMNQGKLEVVKQEMARVNVDNLGINKLKWTGMGEFNSDDHYIYYCGQGSLRRNGVAIMVNKSPKCSTWMQSQKWQTDLCSFPRQTIQYHGNPSLCPNQ